MSTSSTNSTQKNRSNFFLLHPFVHFSDPFQILVAIQRIERHVCVTSPWNATHTKPSHTLAGWGLSVPRLLLLLRLPQGIVFQPLDVRRRLFCTVSQIHTRSFYLQKNSFICSLCLYIHINHTHSSERERENLCFHISLC